MARDDAVTGVLLLFEAEIVRAVSDKLIKLLKRALVEEKVDAKLKANPKQSYSDALKEVMSENEGLEQRYDEGLTPKRNKK